MRYISKNFLSPCAGETGSVVVEVTTPRVKDLYLYGSGKDAIINPDMEGTLTFRACYGEPVKLDFNCCSQKDFEKRISKLDLIIEEVTKMRGQMTEMWYSHLRDIEHRMKESKEGK